MKVLHVAHGAPGGIGRVETLLAEVWERDRRLEVSTVRRMTHPRYIQPAAPAAQKSMGRLRWGGAILLALLRTWPEVLILNHLNLSPIAIFFRLLRPRGRVVVWAYGVEAWKRPPAWQRLALRLVDQVWSISDYTARRFSEVAGFPAWRIVIVPLALTPERAEALSRKGQQDLSAGAQVLTVSRLSRRHGEGKGVDHLIEALASTGADVSLVIVGDGDDRPRLERLATRAGVASRVRFEGHADEATLVKLYRNCGLVALPSSREGFGLVFLEAMVAGKPVVAARAGAVPELVLDHITGLLVPVEDSLALVAAISKLVEDPQLAASLGEAGRQRALTDFGFDRFADRIMELLLAQRAA